nr:MAG TPA: hypothetical protein [Caudoviricetes sp.]
MKADLISAKRHVNSWCWCKSNHAFRLVMIVLA